MPGSKKSRKKVKESIIFAFSPLLKKEKQIKRFASFLPLILAFLPRELRLSEEKNLNTKSSLWKWRKKSWRGLRRE